MFALTFFECWPGTAPAGISWLLRQFGFVETPKNSFVSEAEIHDAEPWVLVRDPRLVVQRQIIGFSGAYALHMLSPRNSSVAGMVVETMHDAGGCSPSSAFSTTPTSLRHGWTGEGFWWRPVWSEFDAGHEFPHIDVEDERGSGNTVDNIAADSWHLSCSFSITFRAKRLQRPVVKNTLVHGSLYGANHDSAKVSPIDFQKIQKDPKV